MFERFTEHARRTIFFARDEASRLRSAYIETEHLLLGILREDKRLQRELPKGAPEAIQRRIEELQSPRSFCVSHRPRSPAESRVETRSCICRRGIRDLAPQDYQLRPLGTRPGTRDRLRALSWSRWRVHIARQSDWLGRLWAGRRVIQPIDPSPAQAAQRPTAWHELEAPEPTAPSLKKPVQAMQDLVNSTLEHLQGQSVVYSEQRLKRRPWTRKEAFGHLIDWAAAHQQWFARSLTEPKLVAAAYPADEWVSAQQYGDFPWKETLDLWVSLNHLLIHVLARFPEDKLKIPCRIGIAEPIPLSELIARYVAHCDDVVGQILAHP
jgi:hypothetical protein